MSDFDPSREPVFWTSTLPGYNDRDRHRVRFENGKKLVERIPQRGHMGDYENRRPARGIRSVRVIRHDGHLVDSVLTNGAAHLDHTTSYGQYMQAKWRFFGWIPLGSCPLALLAIGSIERDHLHDQSILADQPCAPGSCSEKDPCKHATAELAARRKSRATETSELQARFRDPAEKMVDAQREQTAALTSVIADVLAKANTAEALAKSVVEVPTTRSTKEPKEPR
jgi:hypothetical protein